MKYKLWFLRILMGTGIVLVIAQEGILWAESGAPAFHPKALMVLLSLLTALAATFYSKLNSPGRARLQGLRQSESALFREESGRTRRLFYRGLRAWLARDWTAAGHHLTLAAQRAQSPRAQGRILYYLGRCAMEAQRPDQAVQCLERSTRLNPSQEDAWALLAAVCFSTRQGGAGPRRLRDRPELLPRQRPAPRQPGGGSGPARRSAAGIAPLYRRRALPTHQPHLRHESGPDLGRPGVGATGGDSLCPGRHPGLFRSQGRPAAHGSAVGAGQALPR